MNPLKKFVSSFVALTTIVWSMGGALLFPGIAQAATLSPGDLIKASGPAVYYYASSGKRFVFPNEKTYFSWYSDFGSVKTITDSELAAILIGGNVTIRPGTKLVKITTDPKTYAISDRCGTLHWVQTEAIAKSLYGDNWAQRIVDVPDAFFVDYEVGSAIATAVHPDGTLIKIAGDSNTYVIQGGQKRKLAGTSIADNRLNTANAIQTTITYANGTDVTGAETDLKEVACGTASVPSVSGGVSVALASDTPAGRTVPKNSSSNALIKVNLTAGNAAARVSGLRIKRVGAGAASDIANVYLYNKDLVRLTSGRTINSTTHIVEFNSLGIDVPANTTVPVYVYADFDASTAGGEHAIQIADAASVVMEGSGTVQGSFPITGNTFVVGNVSAARVDVNKGVTPSNPTVGSKAVEISNFKLTANTNDVEVRQINLYQAGNIANTDLSNFKLVQGTTVVATADAVSSKNLITLVFNPPYVISSGITKVFSLKADVGGRSSRTIRTYIEYTTDVTAIDRIYNSGAAICIDNADTGGCSGASQGSFDGDSASSRTDYIEVTTQGGQLTIAFNGPTSANVAKGSLGVPFFDFAMTSETGDLEIRNLDFSIAGTVATSYVHGSGDTDYFRNFKVVDIDTGATVMGPISMPSSLSGAQSSSGNMQFTDSWTLKSGTTRNLRIVVDISNSEDATNELYGNGQNQYKLTLAAWGSTDVRDVDTGEFLATTKIVPSAAVTGNPMTVKQAGLTVGIASEPLGTTVVKKQQNLPSVGISLASGQQSDVTVTSIKLTGMAQTQGTGYSLAKFDQLVTKVALFDGDTQVGDAKVPSSGVATISNFQLLIPKGTTKTLVAKATVASTISTTTSTDDFAIGIASTDDVTAQDQDANTVTPSLSGDLIANAAATGQVVIQKVRNSGTITIQGDSQPQSTIFVGGGSAWKVMARYKATAQYEDGKIDRVAVLHPDDSGVNGDFSMVAIASAGDTTNRTDVLNAGTTSTKDINLSVNPIMVPKGQSVSFEIWAKMATPVSSSTATANSPRTGDAPALGVATDTQSGEWTSSYDNQINVRTTGQASGEYLYSTSTNGLVGNTMVLRKGKPVVTKLTPSSLTLTSGSPAELYKFQIAPDADGANIAWKQIIFTVATSAATGQVSLSSFELYKGSTKLSTTAGSEEVFIRRQADGADLTGSTALAGSTQVIVRLVNEESVTGSGTVYTLRATPSFTGTGTSISTSILASTAVTTGYIVDGGGGTPAPTYVGSLYVDPSTAPATSASSSAGVTFLPGNFLWSDNTDIPHSSASGTLLGSRDWTNGTYVSDISQTQSLTQ
jgi:hypothetical protein